MTRSAIESTPRLPARGRKRGRHVRLPAAVVLAALALATPAFGDPWYESYAKAEKALAEERWAEAVAELNRGLEKKADSGARVRTYGMKVIAYFPYLKLGVAYYHLGEIDAALQAFETEERLGAIADSAEDLAELRRYRELARSALAAEKQRKEERRRQIVEANLADARRLEGEGLLDRAMAAVGNALAVSPDDRDAAALMDRLRAAASRREQEQDVAERAAKLTARGRELLATGELAEAAGALRQALALEPSEEAQALWEQAQAGLRKRLEAAREADRSALLAGGLEEARRLEEAGRLGPALDRLQTLLAVEPTHREALALQDRLLRAKGAADEEAERSETVAALLAATQVELDGRRFENSVSTANRVLALDPGNATALGYVAAAYREIGRRLLGTGPRQNIPPAIRFVDRRRELADGTLAQLVREPRLLLSGVVVDDSPVEVALFAADESAIEPTVRSQPLGDYILTEFTVESDLAPGHSVFRLVATDAERLSSSSEYAVVYERPWLRSPAAWGTFAAVLLIGSGALYGRRAARLARLRRRRFNPYVAGAPVLDEELFFGREELLARILQTVHNNSLLLFGERRIGKTSIQHQLKRRLQALDDPDYVFYPVFVDLQGTPEERFFATLAEEVFDQLAPSLDGLAPAVSTDGDYRYRHFVRDLHSAIKALKAGSDKKVKLVLLIDEVDELNAYDPRINQKLRSLFMKSFAENLVSVVSGVEIRKRWEREGSPWYNFFEAIEVEPLRPGEARELIERPIRGVFTLEPGVVERILALTDAKPYPIQRLCISLVHRMHEAGRYRVTVADVDDVGHPEGG